MRVVNHINADELTDYELVVYHHHGDGLVLARHQSVELVVSINVAGRRVFEIFVLAILAAMLTFVAVTGPISAAAATIGEGQPEIGQLSRACTGHDMNARVDAAANSSTGVVRRRAKLLTATIPGASDILHSGSLKRPNEISLTRLRSTQASLLPIPISGYCTSGFPSIVRQSIGFAGPVS